MLVEYSENFQRWHLDMFGYELGKWTYWEKYCISVNSSWDNAGNNNNVMGHYWSHAKHRTSLLFKYSLYFGSFAPRVSTKIKQRLRLSLLNYTISLWNPHYKIYRKFIKICLKSILRPQDPLFQGEISGWKWCGQINPKLLGLIKSACNQ